MATLRYVGFLVFTVVAATGANASGLAQFGIEEIAPGVYLHRGAHADLDDSGRADSANIGFIIGSRCVAVIDTGGAVATGRELAASITAVTDKPICYVINTHVHFDHVLGNAAFANAGAEFVGHKNLAEAMRANRDFFAAAFAAELAGVNRAGAIVLPTVLVDGRLDIDLGDRSLRLNAVQTAHTNADLTVYDQLSDTLWTGDLLFRERMPIIDGSLKGWLKWMEDAQQQTYLLVIPGHGPPAHSWPGDGAPQHDYFNALLRQVREAIRAGRFQDDAEATIAAKERERWILTARAHPLNIGRTFRELEWE